MDEQSSNLTNLQHWTTELDARELAQVQHAQDYAERHASAGAPGHGQFLLIAKMARQLEAREHAILATVRTPVIQQVAWSESDTCWRDVRTGVKVQVS
jgi:hypothetical protein